MRYMCQPDRQPHHEPSDGPDGQPPSPAKPCHEPYNESGLREYDLRTKERVDCDQVVNDRRRLVAREHCSLIRDEHTNNVYVKSKRA